ncbi:MAG: hypothetical protein SF028_11100 [Candidatus Sumerlaeia bacterium]|nr:hypothetical protein [Candidatus Sumerlaeia bacterium]
MRKTALPLLLAALAASGCGRLLDINLFVVGEQTALERQVLGAYGELDRSLLAYSSVRGVQPDGSLRPPPPMSESQRTVQQAMQNRQYNRDDLDLLLAYKLVAERNDGLIEATVQPFPDVERITSELVARILEEENADRAAIMARLLATVPGLRPGDEADVRWVFASLNQGIAPEGSLLQRRDGEWTTK